MHSHQPPGVVQNWSTLQCSKQNTEQCGYDHAPVTRGRMRAQFPLPHGPCKPIPIPIPCVRRGGTMVHYVFWLFSGGAPASQPARGGGGGGGFQSLPATQPRLGANLVHS